jgi:glycosyltransferase involved in cell wall biosynthesis
VTGGRQAVAADAGARPLRILHVVQGYAPAIGGTELLVQKLSEQLARRHGDEVTVYAADGYNCELFWDRSRPRLPSGTERVHGVTVRRFRVFNALAPLWRAAERAGSRLGAPGLDWLRTLRQGPLLPGLTRAVAAYRGDVVAASSFPLLHMFAAQRGARRARRPIVFINGLHPEDAWGYDRANILAAIGRADASICYTEFERDHLLRRGIEPGRLAVTGVGVDPEPFQGADGAAARQRFGWGAAPVVGFVGQHVGHKGIDALIHAMQRVWRTRPEARLLIAGSTTAYTPEIDRLTATLAAQERSRLVRVDDFSEHEKPGLLAACDVFAYPSGFESFGISFLEAWAAGKPVIGCRAGAVSCVVDDERDGLLVRYRDADELAAAILRLLDDASLRRALGEAGRRKVQDRFTWASVAERYRGVYLRAVREHGAGAPALSPRPSGSGPGGSVAERAGRSA